MHFSLVWSMFNLNHCAILFPLEPCPNNVFHIPAFIIGNINVTMGQTILILLIRYRRVAVRLPPTIFNVANLLPLGFIQMNEEDRFCEKKKKKKGGRSNSV